MTRSQVHLVARPGGRDELLQELDRLEVFVPVRTQAGFLSAEVLVPEDDPDRLLLQGSWSSAEHFERWRSSPARAELLDRLRPFLAAEPEARVYHVADAIG